MPVGREMSEGRKRSSHLTAPGEQVGCGMMHSSSTGDLYTASSLPASSPMHKDMLSPDCDYSAPGETVLLGQQMQRCTDSLVALRILFTSRDSQGERFYRCHVER